jgi:hypothetical protein
VLAGSLGFAALGFVPLTAAAMLLLLVGLQARDVRAANSA